MSRQKKIQLENGTILFLGAAAFILLAASLFPSSAMSQKVRSYLEMNRMVERAFAVMLLVSVAVNQEFGDAVTGVMTTFVICTVSGMAGGMCA